MQGTRRWFLGSAGVTGASLAALGRAMAGPAHLRRAPGGDCGRLERDPDGVLDLPAGFTYTIFSRQGEALDDGFEVPALHDGMAAFPGPDGTTVLVRNHEIVTGDCCGPFGRDNVLLPKADPAKIFDRGHGRTPALGGTTTLTFDTREQRLVRHHLSLAGTTRNCAGGSTPWGSWISCEEYPVRANEVHEEDHGWCFEVPAAADGLVDPVPLKAMGRFNHEAVAVHADTGTVYLTEDESDGLLYRFLPDVPGELAQGGRLQALTVRGAPSLDTRNWSAFTRFPAGEPVEVGWVDLDDVEAQHGDLRDGGFVRGAARFARGEGMHAAPDGIYFACTLGGPARAGQIFRYVPSESEGERRELRVRGTLELFAESPHRRLLDMCDNIVVAPWGDVIACEDGPGTNSLVGITQRGDIYPLARNALVGEDGSSSELAGATFSPDGSTLFCNLQGPGLTVAITGPWPS